MTVLFCTVFYYGVATQSSAINVPPLSIVKMRETSGLFILISAYEGGVGHVYSQRRGRGQRKIFWGGAPNPDIFCPPNKNSWRRHCIQFIIAIIRFRYGLLHRLRIHHFSISQLYRIINKLF